MRKIIVRLMTDEGAEEPYDNGWKVYSFSNRHRSFKHPDEFFRDGKPTLGLRRKLATGTAFLLSYYEHSGCVWSLKDEGPQDRWDSVGLAGILIWEEKPKDLPKTFDDRQKWARSYLESYTCWCNGEVYGYSVEEEVTLACGHTEIRDIDSCHGYYGNDLEYLASEVREHLEPGDEVTIEGEAKDLACYHDFKTPPLPAKKGDPCASSTS